VSAFLDHPVYLAGRPSPWALAHILVVYNEQQKNPGSEKAGHVCGKKSKTGRTTSIFGGTNSIA